MSSIPNPQSAPRFLYDDRGSYPHVVFAPGDNLCMVVDRQHDTTLYTTSRPLAQMARNALEAYTDPQRNVLNISLYVLFPTSGRDTGFPTGYRMADLEAEVAVPIPILPQAIMDDTHPTPMLSRIAWTAHVLLDANLEKSRVAFLDAGGLQRPFIVADRVGFGQVRLSRPDDDTWTRQYNY
jgi:hypothetical protein